MKELLTTLEKIKDEILSEKGGLLFLALFSRNDKSEKFDLVVSANWVEDGKTREVVKLLLNKFSKFGFHYDQYIEDFVALSPNENFLQHIASAYKNGSIEKSEDGYSLLKLFPDFVIKAKVVFADFTSHEVITLPNTRKSKKIEEPVF